MTAAASKSRILIAEDNPQGAELIEAYLSDDAWELQTVHDGEATLKAVDDFRPDLLLLDIMMPKLSGFEVCKRLRAKDATKNLPILTITALDQNSDIDRAVEAGANDFLTKPINKTDLIQRVRAMLASRGGDALNQTLSYFEAVSRPMP